MVSIMAVQRPYKAGLLKQNSTDPSSFHPSLTFVLCPVHFQHQLVNLFLLHNVQILQEEATKTLTPSTGAQTPTQAPCHQHLLKGSHQELTRAAPVTVTQQQLTAELDVPPPYPSSLSSAPAFAAGLSAHKAQRNLIQADFSRSPQIPFQTTLLG